MSQNALGQSDCRIFKSTVSQEQIYEIAWFSACLYKFMKLKVLGEHGQKLSCPLWLRYSNVGCFLRVSRWNKLIFCMLTQIQCIYTATKRMRITRNSSNLKRINVRHNFLKIPFFSSLISEWKKLDLKIRDSNTLESFKKQILNFIRPGQNSTFNYKTHRELNFSIAQIIRFKDRPFWIKCVLLTQISWPRKKQVLIWKIGF